jgi:hypothetical protein
VGTEEFRVSGFLTREAIRPKGSFFSTRDSENSLVSEGLLSAFSQANLGNNGINFSMPLLDETPDRGARR